jgi:hypothetical protein
MPHCWKLLRVGKCRGAGVKSCGWKILSNIWNRTREELAVEVRKGGDSGYAWVLGAPGMPVNQQANIGNIHLSFCSIKYDTQMLYLGCFRLKVQNRQL